MKSYKTFKNSVMIEMSKEEAFDFYRESIAYSLSSTTRRIRDSIEQTYLINGIDLNKEVIDSLTPKDVFPIDNTKKQCYN